MTDLSDADLMSRVQTGDRRAFATLIDKHKHHIVNYLTALTRDRDRSEELAQEVFLRLFEYAPKYSEQGQFSAFLFRIATNLVRGDERKTFSMTMDSKCFNKIVPIEEEGEPIDEGEEEE